MHLSRSLSLLLLMVSAVVPTIPTAPSTDLYEVANADHSITTRDVCILGGGASGTFAAIRLKAMGKSVVVIESQDKLGGHTETWTDPGTGATVELGVETWHNTSAARAFLSHFEIQVLPGPAVHDQVNRWVDSVTGKLMDRGTGYKPEEILAALGRYAEQRAKHVEINSGYHLSYPVPEDLTMSFADFAKKYHLQAIVYFFYIQKQGGNDFLLEPALYVLKEFSVDRVAGNILDTTMNAQTGNMHHIYDTALKELGENVLLGSRLFKTWRNLDDYILMVVTTPLGRKTIRAKTLLITAPPLISNLAGLDFSAEETRLFTKFIPHYFYTGILNTTSLASDAWYMFAAEGADFKIPRLPTPYWLRSSHIPGIFDFKYGHDKAEVSPDAVKNHVLSDLHRMCISRDFNTTALCDAHIVTLASHSPYDLQVSARDIEDGFYQQLYALQGKKRTFYTGAAFAGHDSGELWDFTEELLRKIVVHL